MQVLLELEKEIEDSLPQFQEMLLSLRSNLVSLNPRQTIYVPIAKMIIRPRKLLLCESAY